MFGMTLRRDDEQGGGGWSCRLDVEQGRARGDQKRMEFGVVRKESENSHDVTPVDRSTALACSAIFIHDPCPSRLYDLL